VLGVVMGTGTIIGVGAILTGLDTSITSILQSFGPNSIIVFKFAAGFRTSAPTPEERTRKDLTYQNAGNILQRCRSCEEVSPMLFVDNDFLRAKYGGNDMYGLNLIGVEEAYANGGQVDLHLGRFLRTKKIDNVHRWQ
jgi:putative ABC transport system permease protein